MTHVVTSNGDGRRGRAAASGNSYEAVEENINVYLGIFRQVNSYFSYFCNGLLLSAMSRLLLLIRGLRGAGSLV